MQFERAFAAMKSGRADALQVLGDPVFFSNRSRLLQHRRKEPAAGDLRRRGNGA